ncbi:MAG: hypothetical protein GXO37_04745, partial [Chloroflexi bacterium]|nr:hypothetical protein [Chloroflexota bacterium]
RRLRFAEPFKPSQRDEARQILSHWLDVWRAVWRMQWAPESVSAPPGWEPTLRAWAQAVPPDETRARLEDLLTALEDLERYANPRLVLGAVLMAWPQVHLAPPRPT